LSNPTDNLGRADLPGFFDAFHRHHLFHNPPGLYSALLLLYTGILKNSFISWAKKPKIVHSFCLPLTLFFAQSNCFVMLSTSFSWQVCPGERVVPFLDSIQESDSFLVQPEQKDCGATRRRGSPATCFNLCLFFSPFVVK
jgi:hypothetical protein